MIRFKSNEPGVRIEGGYQSRPYIAWQSRHSTKAGRHHSHRIDFHPYIALLFRHCTNTLAIPVLLAVILLLTTASVCDASRGGSAGQDVLLAPNGMDTKASSADDLKQDAQQKCGKGGGGGGGQGAGGRWQSSGLHSSFAMFGGKRSFDDAAPSAPVYALNNPITQSMFSGSGESAPESNTPTPNFQGTPVYGSYGGTNYPNYGSSTSQPMTRQPMHPQRGPAPKGHPRDAVDAGLPPCCKDKLPCCLNNWPCCQKAEYHGYTPDGAPSNLPYSQNMQGKDNVLKEGDTKQNQQGLDNNQNQNNNAQSQSKTSQTSPAKSEMLAPSPGQTMTGLGGALGGSMKQMMQKSGAMGAAGGKMGNAASGGVQGIMNAFNSMIGGQAPGANKEQKKNEQAMEKTVTADNLAGMEREQAATAIEFVLGFLQNFTSGGNKFVELHDRLFLPMAVLLLLPGAVLAQVKAIAAQGFSVLGEVSPFEGLTRSIIAIFLIMSSGLIVNYGIDIANSLVQTVASGYNQNFGSNMGSDAAALHVRAHPIRLPEEEYGVIPPDIECVMFNYFGSTPAASMEGSLLAIKYEDPAAGLYIAPPDRAMETIPFKVPFAREAFNQIDCGMAFAWVILCTIQESYLYYLYFVGPVIAALWVYPSQMLRQAFPNWVEGVVCLCFWSFFWATTICLMACFRGCDDTGTLVCTALLSLALISAKSAFDFVGLAKEAGRDAAKVADKVGQALLAAHHAKAAAGGGPGPGPGPGGPGGPGGEPGPSASGGPGEPGPGCKT